MPIKKSELYSTLWASCDELRGGMDASQYKDYVLVLLFIKYVSDKYAGVPFAPITVPEGSSFRDMVQLKGKPTIGDDINKKILGPLAAANKISDVPDFNDVNKLGSGKEMVDRLTRLIAIFENPALDFSKNRAEGDDLLGDAYEYLMRHFATESGKSKGQFYTPAEVSRILAKVIGINQVKATSFTSVYDPTCGSGSLLLKVADEAGVNVSLYGQEMDNATAALARMNMILHNNPTAEVKQGNTIANPLFLEDASRLKTFDFVVANPPFSFKAWSNGINPTEDAFGRFRDYGIPPEKNGDYAFLLHILKSLKSQGKGAVILPHGVLFRGNAEADIRRNLIQRGYIKGIIGLPANLFYGTGIPACVIVVDKEGANNRKSIFMVDASKGYIKDGNKNRLREQDIHKIVDVFTRQVDVLGYSRNVPMEEISDARNDYNLNIPRYIDSLEEEDLQDIAAHLLGGIPDHDIAMLQPYWDACPELKADLFVPSDWEGYWELRVEKEAIRATIYQHPDYSAYTAQIKNVFETWKGATSSYLRALEAGCKPKEVIYRISEDLLHAFEGQSLVDAYDIYQHMLDYWNESMQDDVYELSADGWQCGSEVRRLVKESKNARKEIVQKEVEGLDGLEGRLLPPHLVISVFFSAEQEAINSLTARRESLQAQMEELKEEHSGEDGLLTEVLDDKGKVNKKAIQQTLKAIGKPTDETLAEWEVLKTYQDLLDEEAALGTSLKAALASLEQKVLGQYPQLSEQEVKTLVVDQKWMAAISDQIDAELQQISQRLTQRINALAERYEYTLPQLTDKVKEEEEKVNAHLQKMGFVWS